MKRRTKVILLSAAVLLALPPACVAGVVLKEAHDVRRAKDAAAEGLGDAVPDAQELAEEQRAEVHQRERLPAPVATWQQLDCRMESVDVGWTIESWEQVCFLHSVEVFPNPRDPDPCRRFDVPGATDADWSGTPAEVFPASSTELANGDWARRCPDVTASFPGQGVAVLLAGELPSAVPPGRRWLVLRISTPVTSDDIGCRPLSLLCDSPGGPTLPDGLG